MLKFDLSDFKRMARNLDALEKQVPFALATTLNSSLKVVRRETIEGVWPAHVEVRNRNALRQALRMEFARKNRLSAAIVGSGPAAERLNLTSHARGGPRDHKGRRLAIAPKGTVKRGARGVAKGQQPRAIIAKTPKRALRITDHGILVGEGGRLRLKYTLVPRATIKPDVPFESEFARRMSREMVRQFPIAMAKAMKTAFRR